MLLVQNTPDDPEPLKKGDPLYVTKYFLKCQICLRMKGGCSLFKGSTVSHSTKY